MVKRQPGVACILAGALLLVGIVPAIAVTPITGIGVDVVLVDEGDYVVVNGDRYVTQRDAVLTVIETTTDPRVTGAATLTVGGSFPAVWYWWLVRGYPYPDRRASWRHDARFVSAGELRGIVAGTTARPRLGRRIAPRRRRHAGVWSLRRADVPLPPRDDAVRVLERVRLDLRGEVIVSLGVVRQARSGPTPDACSGTRLSRPAPRLTDRPGQRATGGHSHLGDDAAVRHAVQRCGRPRCAARTRAPP